MIMLPGWLLSKLTYPQMYSFTLALQVFLLALSLSIFTFLSRCLVFSAKKKTLNLFATKPKASRESVALDVIKKTNLPYLELEAPQESIQKKGDKCLTYFDFFHSTLSWLSYILFSIVPTCFSGFNLIPMWVSFILVLLIISLKLTQIFRKRFPSSLGVHCKGRKNFFTPWMKMAKSYPKTLILYITLLVSLSSSIPLLTYKSCMNDHVEGYGIPLYTDFIYSSALTRFLSLSKVCGTEAPCHVYATVPFNTSSSVFINVHTNIQITTLTINYDTVQNFESKGTLAYSQISSFMLEPDYDVTGERNIHSVLLIDLQPDQIYIIEIFYNNKAQALTKYQTLPDEHSTSNYTLIYGGDIGHSAASQKMAEVVALKNPRALIIGGDIAYDDGECNCYYTMDLFLWMMERTIFEKVGRLIPMIFAIGNHDVGFYSQGNFKVPITENGPSFYINFPQNLPSVSEKGHNVIPNVQERTTYRAHMIGNILNVILDSGYIADHTGAQLEWLKNISAEYKYSPKIAIYHDPLSSPCYSKKISNNTLLKGAGNWVPIFTEYKYMSVFEHHAHIFKKTFPLIGLERAPNDIGTIYFGDGSWGVLGYCKNGDSLLSEGIYESFASLNSIWSVEVDPTSSRIHYEPIGLNNLSIDKRSSQNMLYYIL